MSNQYASAQMGGPVEGEAQGSTQEPSEDFQTALWCIESFNGCSKTFHATDSEAWREHVRSHLPEPLPDILDCWFSKDDYCLVRFDVKEYAGCSLEANFVVWMDHIYAHILSDPRLVMTRSGTHLQDQYSEPEHCVTFEHELSRESDVQKPALQVDSEEDRLRKDSEWVPVDLAREERQRRGPRGKGKRVDS